MKVYEDSGRLQDARYQRQRVGTNEVESIVSKPTDLRLRPLPSSNWITTESLFNRSVLDLVGLLPAGSTITGASLNGVPLKLQIDSLHRLTASPRVPLEGGRLTVHLKAPEVAPRQLACKRGTPAAGPDGNQPCNSRQATAAPAPFTYGLQARS